MGLMKLCKPYILKYDQFFKKKVKIIANYINILGINFGITVKVEDTKTVIKKQSCYDKNI